MPASCSAPHSFRHYLFTVWPHARRVFVHCFSMPRPSSARQLIITVPSKVVAKRAYSGIRRVEYICSFRVPPFSALYIFGRPADPPWPGMWRRYHSSLYLVFSTSLQTEDIHVCSTPPPPAGGSFPRKTPCQCPPLLPLHGYLVDVAVTLVFNVFRAPHRGSMRSCYFVFPFWG